jgi:hypothetical protein
MFSHCIVCGCKVNINNCKYVTFKGKGSKTRTRIEGVCEKGHKFARFAKSSGGKSSSSSKTMKGGAGPGDDVGADVGDMNKQQNEQIYEQAYTKWRNFERANPELKDNKNKDLYNEWEKLLDNVDRTSAKVGRAYLEHRHRQDYQ